MFQLQSAWYAFSVVLLSDTQCCGHSLCIFVTCLVLHHVLFCFVGVMVTKIAEVATRDVKREPENR